MDVVFDPVKIRKDYLKTWFIIDLASSIPWDILISFFTDGGANHASFVRFLKVMTILKLLRGRVRHYTLVN